MKNALSRVHSCSLFSSDCGQANMDEQLLKFDQSCFNDTSYIYVTTGNSYASDNVWVTKFS